MEVDGVTWLGVGDTISVTLKFDEAVVVHGAPTLVTLKLLLGSDVVVAQYDALGGNADELVFSYTTSRRLTYPPTCTARH